MRIRRTLGLLAIAAICVFALASPAVAASKITPFDTINAGVIGSGVESVMIVTGTLPKTVTLPATIDIAVPKGATVGWFGEIDDTGKGGDFEIKHTPRTEGEYDIYTATVTKYKTVQAEVSTGVAYAGNDGIARFAYAPATDTATLVLGVEIPATAKYTPKANYTDLGKGKEGSVYGTTFTNVKAGESVEASFDFKTAAAANSTGAKGGSTSVLITVLIVVLVVAIGGLIFVLAQNKIKNGPTGGASAGKRASSASSATLKQPTSSTKNAAPVAEPVKKKINPALVITGIIALVAIVALIAAGSFSSKVTMVNGIYMKEFAQGDPCSSVDYALSEAAVSNHEKTAGKIFDLLGDSELTILKASLDPASNKLTVEYCESQETPEDINAVINPTGLVVD